MQAVASRKTSAEPTSCTYSVNNMLLPTSVLYYEPEGAFEVWDDYYVNPGNPNYASTKEGILTSKDGSEYVGVPLSRKELAVPAGVKSVTLSGLNQLDQITIAAAGAADLPAIDLGKLKSCNITLADDALIGYIEQNYQQLASSCDVTVSSADAPEVRYTCSGGMVFSDEQLLRVVSTGSSATFVQGPHTLESGCFEGCTNVDTVVLFDEGDFTLEDGCFTGGNVSTVICFTEDQAAYAQSRLDAAGAPNAQVILPAESEEGFIYYEQDGKVCLLSSQDSVETFTGTLTDDDGAVRTIDTVLPYAFSDSYALKWVNLSAGTSSIGAKAFAGCANLQGVFFGGEGDVTVGADAFEGCTSLGFVGSNARSLACATQEVPNKDCVWYRPATATGGYDSRFTQFTDIERLSVATQDDGSLVLCGNSSDGVAFIALGSGTSYEGGMLALPSTIRTIYRDAFADLGGEWQVDWSGMDALSYIGSGAFRESGIAGDVKIDAHGEDLAIGSAAFGSCAQLTSLGIENALSLDIGNEAFADCATLERVTLGTLAEAGGDAGNLGTNVFTSCPAFKLLEFTSSAPLQLNLYSPGIAWSIGEPAEDAEESADVRIKVPAGSEENYLSSWVYALAGYANHDDYFAAVQFSLIEETFEMPSDAEVRAKMAKDLLAPENLLRKMMGLPEVDASTVIVETTFSVGGFEFDAGDGSGPVTLAASESEQEALLAAWPMRMLGFADEEALDSHAFDVFGSLIDWDTFEMPTAEALDEAINGPLMVQENRLRAMLGLPQIASTDELAYAYDVSTLVG